MNINIKKYENKYCFFQDMNDAQWERAISHLNHISELSYLTQIVFMQYEDPTADPLSEDRFHIEVFFR